jgi:ABC-type Fe3+ transport system substrate-binding protein
MTNTFELLKNGKVSTAVWANPTTKEIYPANRNSFGYNAQYHYGDDFYSKYGKGLKTNAGKVARGLFYSAMSMESVGFKLVVRGSQPLWK